MPKEILQSGKDYVEAESEWQVLNSPGEITFMGFIGQGRVTCFKIPPLSNGKRDQETEWKKKMGERQQATWEWHLGYPNSFSLPRSKRTSFLDVRPCGSGDIWPED